MPRHYKCKKCGKAHATPTGKHCREFYHPDEEKNGQTTEGMMPLLLDIHEKIKDMDRRVSSIEGSGAGSVIEEPDNVLHSELETVETHETDKILPLLIEIKRQVGDIDRRVSSVENTGAGSATGNSAVHQPKRTTDKTQDTGTDSLENDASPASLRRNNDIMARAARRLARIRAIDEEYENDLEDSRSRLGGKKSGSLLVANESVVERIDWPHLYVTRQAGGARKGVAYAELRIEEFVFGFISMLESPQCKWDYRTMTRILRMLMQDTMDFSWSNALALYKLIGVDVENGTIDWSDKAAIQEMRFTHSRIVLPDKKDNRDGPKAAPKTAPSDMRVCTSYQTQTCPQDRDHPPFTHACAYCHRTCAIVCRHSEAVCIRRVTDAAKKREEEGAVMLPRKSIMTSDVSARKMGGEKVSTALDVEAPGQAHSRDPGEISNIVMGVTSPRGPNIQALAPTTMTTNTTNGDLRDIYMEVIGRHTYNFAGARRRVPSGLCIEAWKKHLGDYTDYNVVDFLAFGWPINCNRGAPLQSTFTNHPSAAQHPDDIKHYVSTELSFQALAGPFKGPPVRGFHISPLMTRPKKDSDRRRVIVDLSWPDGASVNDGIRVDTYIDGPAEITLPTVDYMENRLLRLGRGAFLYKTDLARGYRQLRVDPGDWPCLGFSHGGQYFMDICPPFGLRTSALFMQRTSEAVCFIHGKKGFFSRPYLDDFGGAEKTCLEAQRALDKLQEIMAELGLQEAKHKVCGPSQQMVWLGLHYDSVEMTISIPQAKLAEIMLLIRDWQGKQRATRTQMQSLVGTLQFVAGVSPPTRIFTNRMLQNVREAPKRGTESLSWGFKKDLAFFSALLPHFNGIKIIDKSDVECQDHLELDACLTGCGACTGSQYYAEQFPSSVVRNEHIIAHLELLNIVVALKVWRLQWAGHRVRIFCDNTVACLAVGSGRSRDDFVQMCVRELFLLTAASDIELYVVHRPGVELSRADALSRLHTAQRYVDFVGRDAVLSRAERIAVPEKYFDIENKL